jgi:hypothetical protein
MPRRLLGKQKSYASAELLVNAAAQQPGNRQSALQHSANSVFKFTSPNIFAIRNGREAS